MKNLVFNNSSSSSGICNLTNDTSPTRSTSGPVATFPRHSAQETLIFVTIYSLLSFLVILGNSLIIIVFTRNSKLRTATNMFFVSLAVSDFIVGAISIPCWMYILLYDLNHTSQSAVNLQFRKVFKFLDVCSALTSIAHLTIISIDRNIAISKPLRHRVMRRYHYYCAIAATWAYGLAVAGIFANDFKFAMWRKYKGLFSAIAGFFLPLLIIICMYANIYKSVKQFNIRRRSYSISSLQRKVHHEQTTAKTVLIVTGLFLLSWLPFFTLSVLFIFWPSYLPHGTNLMHLLDFVKLLHYSNSAINPLVYTYRISEVRSTLMQLIAPCLVQTDAPSARSLPVPLVVQKSPPFGPEKLRHSFSKARVGSVNGRDVNF
ncbi:dopamine receptor 2-like [Orbicella faveolata]|uniref:dopamine receptor 2-like n=1 Tax=Orbicella faveolata TaxID=48498 RepID=UPI0009E259CC|nr:dopamine receptor 2-like [Orbicella faveolata]